MTQPAILSDPDLRAILAALPEARLVGGAVRDHLAGLPIHDIDLATSRHPESVLAALRAAGLKAVTTGLAHGTVTAVVNHRGFEITTLRRDVATDGRHAMVAFTDDWRADAARRDFTINAMSMDQTGAVFDYFGGAADLRAGRLRFVGNPDARIAEDYLRILRYFRFWARFARIAPDAETVAALRAGIPGLARLSAERVWSELSRLLAAPDPWAAVELMHQLGVLAAIVPEGADPARLRTLLATGAPAEPILRLASLLTGDAERLARKLRLSTAERERLVALRQAPAPTPALDDAALRRMLADTPPDILLGRSWLAGTSDADWTSLRERIAHTPRPRFPLEGRDALAIGLPPGPAIGALLRRVRDWWLASGCTASVEDCQRELRRLASSTTTDQG